MSTNRILVLDSLRGIAALLVVLFHGFACAGIQPLKLYILVDFFFILSGFVIHWRYQDLTKLNVKEFISRRFLRIYPLHFVSLCFSLLIICVSQHFFSVEHFCLPRFDWGDVAVHVALLQSLNITDHLSLNFPSWSISAEVFSYFVFAIVMVFCRKYLAIVLMGLLCVCFFMMVSSYDTLDFHYKFGFCRGVFGFILGMLISMSLNNQHKFFEQMYRLPLLEWVSIVSIVVIVSLQVPYIDYLCFVPFCYLIARYARGIQSPISQILQNKVLVYLGKISYSIYLIHFLFIMLFPSNLWLLPIKILLILVASHYSFHYIESKLYKRLK